MESLSNSYNPVWGHLSNLRVMRHLVLFMVVFCPQLEVSAFNIGTSEANVIKGDSGSYFGATVNFLPKKSKYRTTDDVTLLVSATNQTFTTLDGEDVLGVMQVCTGVFGPNYSCTRFHIDDDKAIAKASLTEHFGSAVAVDEDGFHVICSPQWMDTSAQRQYYQFLPGRCSTIDSRKTDETDETRPYYNSRQNWKNYVTSIDKSTLYYEGTALYGVSVDAKKGEFFIAGSPGVLEGEGSVVYTDFQTMSTLKLPVEKRYNIDTTAYGYLGYAVKIGAFCEASMVCFAASAPNLNRVGMVKIFGAVKGQIANGFEIVQMIPGKQAWSYFGYTMAACDANKDGLDELLIGAPHHTDTSDPKQGLDQGLVHVYSRTSTQQKLERFVTLGGSRSKFARFGSAIQCIGDINLDGYVDVAVGAPGEDDGIGAVHIYLGSKTGFSDPASQKISPSSLPGSLSGLGYAISGSQVVKGSNYPVFAVSTIQSDAVVVFSSRPVVVPTVTITAEPNPVDLDVSCSDTKIQGSCFTVKLCPGGSVRGGGNWGNELKVRLDMDTKVKTEKWKRALFQAADGSLVASIPETTVNVIKTPCLTYTAVIMETQVNQDRFSPVFVEAHVKLASTAENNLSPVMDALSPKTFSTAVTFKNACGSNNKCEVDLGVEGTLGYSGHDRQWNSIVVDETKELLVELVVRNKQETAYWTAVEITVDSPLTFSRPLASSDSSVTCQAATPKGEDAADSSQQESTVICNYYKPLETDATVNIGVAFETYDFPLDKAELKVTARVRPNNDATEEMNEIDNSWQGRTPVRIICDVTVDGVSAPPEVTIQKAKRISLTTKADVADGIIVPEHDTNLLAITHKILVQNEGPSNLLPTTLRVSVPFILQDASLLVRRGHVKLTTARGIISTCTPLKDFDVSTGRIKAATTTTSPETVDPINPINPIGPLKPVVPDVSITLGPGDDKEKVTEQGTTETPIVTTTDNSGGLPDPPINRRRRRRDASARKKRSADDINAGNLLPNIYVQSCQLDPQYCQVYECNIDGGIAADSHVEVNVSLSLDKSNIPVPENFDTFYYAIFTEVVQPKHPLFLRWEQARTSQSVTKFHLVQSGGGWNIWIIIGSVIAGLLVITIVALILWKTGFFKRNKHRQVAQWKRESQQRSRVSSAAKPDSKEA